MKSIAGIAPGAAERAAGQPDKDAGLSGVARLALNAMEDLSYSHKLRRETLIVKRLSERYSPDEQPVNVERFTSLFPSRDRPAESLRGTSHAPDRVDDQGVPDHFKEVVIARAIAIGIGAG